MAQEKRFVFISILLFLTTPVALADQLNCLNVNIECPVEYTAANNNTVTSTNCFLKILRRAAFERSGECIETLILKNNHIEEIESRTFERLLNLKELDLSNNDITKLSPETFVGLHNITTLNLSFNHLEGIEKNTFLNLTQLIHLDLSRNNIEEIDGDGFVGLKKLRSLDLSHNKFETLNFKRKKNKISSRLTNYFLSAFTSMESIDLSHNRIAFMGAISPTISIKTLNLSYNELKAWRYDSFVSIEMLDCSHNSISELYFGNNPGPTKLRELDLSHNRISFVTYTEIESTRIKTLRLANNSAGCYQERQYQDQFSKIGVSFIGSSNCRNIPDKVEDESIAIFEEDDSSFNHNNAYVDNKSEAARKTSNWKIVLMILLCATVIEKVVTSMGNLSEKEKVRTAKKEMKLVAKEEGMMSGRGWNSVYRN